MKLTRRPDARETPVNDDTVGRSRPVGTRGAGEPAPEVMDRRRAIDQLIEIGERAGVTTISDRPTLNRLLCAATGLDPNIGRILTAFELDRNGFMILVSLLAAGMRAERFTLRLLQERLPSPLRSFGRFRRLCLGVRR